MLPETFPMAADIRRKRSGNSYLAVLAVLLAAACVLFMTLNAHGNWDFVLPLRGKKLLLLLTVAYAVGISTLMFQTLTHNNILTPGLLGYDQLYMLLQTLLLFFLGATGYGMIGSGGKFLVEAPLMMAASLLLFRTLTKSSNGDLARLILVGVIFGVLFRSINNLLQRLIDPTQFVTVQMSYFAQFTTVNVTLLWAGVLIMAASAVWVWRMRFKLDVLMLGRPAAVGLGLDYVRFSRTVLLWVALLVSVATALVGPVGFFGLLVCALVNATTSVRTHALRLPAAFLVAGLTLVLGQTVFEQLLGMQSVLSVVIEFLGGLVFLWLILKHRR